MVSWAVAGSVVAAKPMASPATALSQRQDCGRAATAGNELSISESSD
jgi:hypothetical protein